LATVVVGEHTTTARGVNDAKPDCADSRIMFTTEIDPATLAEKFHAASAGRSGALDELIRLCRPYVENRAHKYAWSNTDPDDIVQEVWIQLINHIHRIREPLALLGWLNVVTRRLAAHLGRRGGRMIPTDFDDSVVSTSCTEEQALENEERLQVATAIQEALGHLDEDDRALLSMLHPASGTPCYADISRRVHRPVGSLGPTRRRILDRLGKDPAVRHILVHQ
jgi:RNA polymerase sigma factor (sigma-70 family)